MLLLVLYSAQDAAGGGGGGGGGDGGDGGREMGLISAGEQGGCVL
jgi:hypothetical protein